MLEALRCEALSGGLGSRPPRRIRSIIFDTAADDLGKSDIVLRGYEIHGASFLELAWSRPLRSGVDRNSIELRVPTLDLGARLLDFSKDLRRSIGGRPLEARCVTEAERHERLLERDGAEIAVALDDGFVEFHGHRSPFQEIELRLLRGDGAHLWTAAADLARRVPLRCSPMSTRDVALLQITGRDVGPVKAKRPELTAETSLDDAIAVVIGSCLDQFVANWPALTRSQDPDESIHQMRVALRRLRAGIGLFRHGVASIALTQAAAHAKDIAAVLGSARNLDILGDMLASGQLAGMSAEPSFYALLDSVECRRTTAHETVRKLIEIAETTRFVLDLRATLAVRNWTEVPRDRRERTEQETPSIDAHAAGSARAFAVSSLDRLHRKAMKKGRDLASSSPQQRHEARIALKKARYAAEFFASLFDARSHARDYLRRSAAIQDRLGASNDMAVAERLLRELGDERRSALSPAHSFAIGWCAHAQSSAAADWKKIQRSLKKLKPFWS